MMTYALSLPSETLKKQSPVRCSSMSSVAVVLSVVESRTAVVKIHAQVGRAASSTPGPISGRRAAAVDVGVAILASGGGRRGRRSGGTLLARCRTPFFSGIHCAYRISPWINS